MVKTGIFCFLFIWPSERLGRGDDFQGSDSSFFHENITHLFKIISIEKIQQRIISFLAKNVPKAQLHVCDGNDAKREILFTNSLRIFSKRMRIKRPKGIRGL